MQATQESHIIEEPLVSDISQPDGLLGIGSWADEYLHVKYSCSGIDLDLVESD
jgi:hypothetical protein